MPDWHAGVHDPSVLFFHFLLPFPQQNSRNQEFLKCLKARFAHYFFYTAIFFVLNSGKDAVISANFFIFQKFAEFVVQHRSMEEA